MARPVKSRYVSPGIKEYSFRPRGVSLADTEMAQLNGDELEAMRLCFVHDHMHVAAARKMRVSRRTLERILCSGRRKVTQALLYGGGINITFPPYVSFSRPRKKRG